MEKGDFGGGVIFDSMPQNPPSIRPSLLSNPSDLSSRWGSESIHSHARLLRDSSSMVPSTRSNLTSRRASFESTATSTATIRGTTVPHTSLRSWSNREIQVELVKLKELISSKIFQLSSGADIGSSSFLVDLTEPVTEPELATHDDDRKAIEEQVKLRSQVNRLSRRYFPLPWGWKWRDSDLIFENNITADSAVTLPLLEMQEILTITHEILPRCITTARDCLESFTGSDSDEIGKIPSEMVTIISHVYDTLLKAMLKFEVILENPTSVDHIFSQMLLIKEYGTTDILVEQTLKTDVLSARRAYTELIQRVLGLLYSCSSISTSGDDDGFERITASLHEKKFKERTLALRAYLTNQEIWLPVEAGLMRVWCWHSVNSQEIEEKTRKISKYWSDIFRIKNGASGDRIVIRIESAITSAGEPLERRHIPLDRIGAFITEPFVPIDKVYLSLRVLADGLFLFQTPMDNRTSLLSRFSWNMSRMVFLRNCSNIEFEVWDRDALMGVKRPAKQIALAKGRITFKALMSPSASLCDVSLQQDAKFTTEVKLVTGKNDRVWGLLKVGLAWEGRDTRVARAITEANPPTELSESKVLMPMMACVDYTNVPRKVGIFR